MANKPVACSNCINIIINNVPNSVQKISGYSAIMSFPHHKQWYNFVKMNMDEAEAGYVSTCKPTLMIYHGIVRSERPVVPRNNS
jgi:hypothetical protein